MSKYKVVVLDGYVLNSGDNPWTDIEKLCDLTVYDRTPTDKVLERAKDAWGILINKTIISKDVIESLPNLKYIGVLATGVNTVDINAAKERKIAVTNIRDYGSQSVAQLAMTFILAFSFRLVEHNDAVHQGLWTKSFDFSFRNYPIMELNKKVLGILGFGGIGKELAKMAESFGMNVIAFSRSKKDGVENVASIEELFSRSDFISLNCPLTEETKGIVNKNTISHIKKTAYIINTSRGQVVVESDVADALNNGEIAGYGTDVLSFEPPKEDNPLLTAKNCYITPHFAGLTLEARIRLMKKAAENLEAFLEDKPINVLTY